MRSRIGDAVPSLGATALLAILLAAISAATVTQDTWLALVAGREVVVHGLPTQNHLTVFGAGHIWVDQQWLAQAAFYGLDRFAGGGAVALGMAAALAAFGGASYLGSRGGTKPLAATAFLIAAVVADPWSIQVRAQELALPLYVALVALLLADEQRVRARTFLCWPIFVVWANVHGSVAFGVAIVCAYAVTARTRRTLALAAGCLVSAFASPYAINLPRYYWTMLVDPPFAGINVEWQPSWPGFLTIGFYLLATVTGVVVLRARNSFTRFEIVLLVLTFASAVVALRNIVWFAVAVVAVVPRRVAPGDPLYGRGVRTLAATCVAVMLATITYAATRHDADRSGSLTPSAAAAVAAAVEHTHGIVFADDLHADWILWHVPSARGRVAYDGRLEILSRAQLLRLIAMRDAASAVPLLARYSVVVETPARTRRLNRWGRVAYSDAATVVVVRPAALLRVGQRWRRCRSTTPSVPGVCV